MEHELKTDPIEFDAIRDGLKNFELRFNDRKFQVGDTVALRRTQHTGYQMKRLQYPLIYTGETERRTVSYILQNPDFGLKDGWVILGLEDPFWERITAAMKEYHDFLAGHIERAAEARNKDVGDTLEMVRLRLDALLVKHKVCEFEINTELDAPTDVSKP